LRNPGAGSSPGATALTGAVCLPGLAGRTRPPLPRRRRWGERRRAGGRAISVTRYGDEAYDFRDVRALARFGVNAGADGVGRSFLGAGMLAQNAIRTTRRSVIPAAANALLAIRYAVQFLL